MRGHLAPKLGPRQAQRGNMAGCQHAALKSRSCSTRGNLGPFGASFARNAAQQRHDMGNIAHNDASSMQKTWGTPMKIGCFEDFGLGLPCPLFLSHVDQVADPNQCIWTMLGRSTNVQISSPVHFLAGLILKLHPQLKLYQADTVHSSHRLLNYRGGVGRFHFQPA